MVPRLAGPYQPGAGAYFRVNQVGGTFEDISCLSHNANYEHMIRGPCFYNLFSESEMMVRTGSILEGSELFLFRGVSSLWGSQQPYEPAYVTTKSDTGHLITTRDATKARKFKFVPATGQLQCLISSTPTCLEFESDMDYASAKCVKCYPSNPKQRMRLQQVR